MSCSTGLPSRVLRLPPPLLPASVGQPLEAQQRRSWTAVRPSPDRAALLLLSHHECQLLAVPHVAAAAVDVVPVVLPQPHRRLTSSCWLSVSLGDDTAVALGDAAAAVTLARRVTTTASASADDGDEWAQHTIFLEEDEDYSSGGVVFSRSRCGARAAVWRAVTAVLPGSYTSHSTAGAPLTVLCQRAGDVYVGSGVAARRPCSAVWLSSTQGGLAWRVPLAAPPGEDEDDGDGGDDGGGGARLSAAATARRPPTLFDVRQHGRRRDAGSSSGGGGVGTGPLGCVFAAAFHRHVGLFTTATVTPAVYFALPTAPRGGGAWRVTSVVEAPSAATLASTTAGGSSSSSGGGHLLLVSAHRHSLAHGGTSTHVLYDSRNSLAPVWVAEETPAAPPVLDSASYADAPVLSEWLPPAGQRRHALWVTYTPATAAKEARHRAGVCVAHDGTAVMEDGALWHDTEGGEDVAPAPLTYELQPPQSLLTASRQALRVRALTYTGDILHYVCEDVS
ncbi:hypothetical protein NESM_000578500 [Novymonas esmeraldas]|uniref:Uncharacterized protein n=1 Tax=Novymonas esmeraldas TaxID=1808958 RepID=A0AAW0ESL0_9TRYP